MALSCQGFSSIVLLWSGGGIAMGARIWGKTPGAWTWRSRPDWRGPTVGPSALFTSRKQEQKQVRYRRPACGGGMDARLIQSRKAAKGSNAYAGAGWSCPEYSRFRPSAQQFLVPVRNERFITPENRMTAPAPDSSFPGADIEHVSGHFV